MPRVVVLEYDEFRSKFVTDHWFPSAKIIRRHEGESLSFAELCRNDLLILSGGRWAPQDDKRFLMEDRQMLIDLARLDRDAPKVLGICLGAQLMATAFGGVVKTEGELVLGWNHIQVRGSHPVFEGMTSLLQLEIHHNHIAKLPPSARLLASSEKDVIEVFSIGDNFLATAYHPEITAGDIGWFRDSQNLDISKILVTTPHVIENSYSFSEQFFANLARWCKTG